MGRNVDKGQMAGDGCYIGVEEHDLLSSPILAWMMVEYTCCGLKGCGVG